MQQWRTEAPAMTFDEVSLERSTSFVKALQELKNLRPQLYSAAEYCEKSYFHNEQKQMVLDNLKEYAVRALVNAVDHLGTVAYKLTDLFEQQTLDVSTVELKVSCLNQQILTCQTYADKEGLRQQQLLATIPRHHKHYILPNFSSKKVQSTQLQTDAGSNHIQRKPRPHPPGSSALKTVSWYLNSEINSIAEGTSNGPLGKEDSKSYIKTSEFFHLQDAKKTVETVPISSRLQSDPTSNVASHTFYMKGPKEVSKPLSAFRSFDDPNRHVICRPPVRSKSMLVAFFARNKYSKQRKASAS